MSPYSYDRRTGSVPTDPVGQLKEDVVEAIKRVGDGVRKMGLGSVVKYNPQTRIGDDHRSVHSTFFLKVDHPQVNSAYRPGISFYWDKSRESGSVSASNLVYGRKKYENLPLAKMGKAMAGIASEILKDLQRQLDQKPSGEAWSVVTTEDGYAASVEVYESKSKAEREARARGDCYVVKGTQMWNEPLGQVEEHDRDAPYRHFP